MKQPVESSVTVHYSLFMCPFKVTRTIPFSQEAIFGVLISINSVTKKMRLSPLVSKILFCGQVRKAIPFFVTKNENRTIKGFSNLGRKKVIHFSLVDKNYLSTAVTLSIRGHMVHWYQVFPWIYYKIVLFLKLWIILKVIHKKAKSAQFYLDHRKRWPCEP